MSWVPIVWSSETWNAWKVSCERLYWLKSSSSRKKVFRKLHDRYPVKVWKSEFSHFTWRIVSFQRRKNKTRQKDCIPTYKNKKKTPPDSRVSSEHWTLSLSFKPKKTAGDFSNTDAFLFFLSLQYRIVSVVSRLFAGRRTITPVTYKVARVGWTCWRPSAAPRIPHCEWT